MERNNTVVQRDNFNIVRQEVLRVLRTLDKLFDLVLGKVVLLTTLPSAKGCPYTHLDLVSNRSTHNKIIKKRGLCPLYLSPVPTTSVPEVTDNSLSGVFEQSMLCIFNVVRSEASSSFCTTVS